MREGRSRGRVRLAPADLSGVRELMSALKRGEAAGFLPDQVPGEGEGEWAEFFGRPAYTMTLAAKLAERDGVRGVPRLREAAAARPGLRRSCCAACRRSSPEKARRGG